MSEGAGDSAGVPWEGREFHPNPSAGDDGSAPERLIEAIRRFRAHELGAGDVVAALRGERLLIPLLAEAGDVGVGAHGQPVDKTQELSLVTAEGPDGRAVLPAFTSVDAMLVWNATARPIPIEVSRIALALAAEGTQLLVLDPGSPTEFVVRHPAFESLATGSRWVPPYEDEAVLDAFLASAAHEAVVRAVQLAPGDPDALLRGSEVKVQLSIDAGLDKQGLDALLARLAERWTEDPTITARVDSVALTVERMPVE
jgi:hypothetical protein